LKYLKDFYKGKRVLITGGAGMIGSIVADISIQLGSKVIILDAMLPLYGGNMFNLREIIDKVEFIKGDIRNRALIEELIPKVDLIFNLAAQVSYQDSMLDPFLDLDINCTGHLNILNAAKTRNPKVRILFSGSRLEYGKILYNPVDEDHPLRPLMTYGIHKVAGEQYHMMYCKDFGIETIAFRISNPYGPRQQMKHSKYGIINYFIRLAMEGKNIKVFGDGSSRKDYVFNQDVAWAMIHAMACKQAVGEVFNIGSGIGTRFVDMVETILRVVGKGALEKVEWPKDYFNVDTGDYISNISKFKKITSWSPGTTLDEGIKITSGYYSKYRDNYWGK
jgi:nucleoside-diphosphate-sugar epimerase